MRQAAVLLAALATGSAAGGANLVQNPGFDIGTSPWFAFIDTALEHAALDELGSPLSGALQVTAHLAGQIGAAAGQCVPVVAGRTYAFGASVFIPEGQSAVVIAAADVSWSSFPDCAEIDLGASPITSTYIVRLHGVWGTTQSWGTAPPGAQSARLVLRVAAGGTQSPHRGYFDNVFFVEDATCAPSATTLCLNDGRFRVIAEWEARHGDAGFGRAVPLTADSGYFWFFNETNVELVAKLIDACATAFNRFWFFAAGLTDVETTVRVQDTGTGARRTYVNPQETPFAPIQDTEAFATCP